LGEPDAVLAFRPVVVRQEGGPLGRGATAVVRAAREAGELSGRGCTSPTCPGGTTPWSTRGLYLPREWTRKKKRMFKAGGAIRGEVPDPSRAGPGDARGARCGPPARVGFRGRRAGPVLVVPPGTAGPRGAVPAGRPVEHLGPGPGRRGAVRGSGGVTRRRRSSVRTGGPPGSRPVRGRRSRCGTPRWGLWWCRSSGRPLRRGPITGRRGHRRCLVVFPGAAGGRVVEARLPAVERSGGHSGGRVRPGVQGPPPGGGGFSSGPRGRPGWATTRCGRGAGGATTRPYHSSRRGFLTQEARRGKKADPGAERPSGPAGHRSGAAPGGGVRPSGPGPSDDGAVAAAERGGPVLPLEATETACPQDVSDVTRLGTQ